MKEDGSLDFSLAMMSKVDDDTIVVSSEERAKKWLHDALASYDPSNKQYSTILSNDASTSTPTQAILTSIGQNAQSDIEKILQANGIIKQYVNTSSIVGMVVSAIQSNINTDIRLSYKNFGDQKKKLNQVAKAKAVIEDFNMQINVREVIRNAILASYLEGNYIGVLRQNNDNWVVDQYPLGIAEISQYTEASRPIVQINISKLRDALQKTILKNKRGKAIYFEDTLKEIQAAFGKEIVDAYKNKDDYCRLPVENTGVVRVNNYGKLYGLSPIFRALSDVLILESLRDADTALAKTKAKAIIHQVMRKECMTNGKYNDFESLAWNHKNLMSAFKQGTVIFTSLPQIEKVEYVTPQTQEVSVDKQNAYSRRILSSLGVAFLVPDEDQSTTTAKISWQVLLQQINAIGEQVERMLENFYRTVLTANGIDLVYMPTVRIIDSEMLDTDQRLELAKILYGTMSSSRSTAFEVLGFDLDDEVSRRQMENENNLNEIFAPYPISYTTAGGGAGRPEGDDVVDEDKQQNDKNRKGGQ